jgi:very-short-patch-repair endonuclease
MERNRPQASRVMVQMARAHRKDPTPHEKELWKYLRRWQRGYRFRRQHPIGQFILDFYCPSARLCIEVDGAVHQTEEQRDRDAIRSALLEVAGIRVLRISNDEVDGQMEQTLARIADALRQPRG